MNLFSFGWDCLRTVRSWQSKLRIASAAPYIKTMSRVIGLSPAMLPSAQTAWSDTTTLSDCNKCTNFGTALAFTTVIVCSVVPAAIFVSTHAASTCNSSLIMENSTKMKCFLGVSTWDRNLHLRIQEPHANRHNSMVNEWIDRWIFASTKNVSHCFHCTQYVRLVTAMHLSDDCSKYSIVLHRFVVHHVSLQSWIRWYWIWYDCVHGTYLEILLTYHSKTSFHASLNPIQRFE